MASIPCAAYQAGHIHDHLRKQHRYDVRVRAASVASDPSQPAQPKAAVITTEEICKCSFPAIQFHFNFCLLSYWAWFIYEFCCWSMLCCTIKSNSPFLLFSPNVKFLLLRRSCLMLDGKTSEADLTSLMHVFISVCTLMHNICLHCSPHNVHWIL